jgi:predicted aspartyl protease
MIDDMGIFRTTLSLGPIAGGNRRRQLDDVMVDTGSEFSWIPRAVLDDLGIAALETERFETADGRILERQIGHAMLYAAGRKSPTIVVFAEPGDMVLLGAFALEGLRVRVDLNRRELVPAGPAPAAVAA